LATSLGWAAEIGHVSKLKHPGIRKSVGRGKKKVNSIWNLIFIPEATPEDIGIFTVWKC